MGARLVNVKSQMQVMIVVIFVVIAGTQFVLSNCTRILVDANVPVCRNLMQIITNLIMSMCVLHKFVYLLDNQQ